MLLILLLNVLFIFTVLYLTALYPEIICLFYFLVGLSALITAISMVFMNTFMWRWCQSYSKEILIVLEILLLTGLVLCLGFGIVYIIKMVFARILIAHCGSKPSKSTLDDVAVEESSWLLNKIWSHIRGWFGYGKRATPPKPPTPPQEEDQPTPQEEGTSTPPATPKPVPLTPVQIKEFNERLAMIEMELKDLRKSIHLYKTILYYSAPQKSDNNIMQEHKLKFETVIKEINKRMVERNELRRLLSLKPITLDEEFITLPETLIPYSRKDIQPWELAKALDIEFNKIDKRNGMFTSATHPIANKVLLDWYNSKNYMSQAIKFELLAKCLRELNGREFNGRIYVK